MKLLSRAIFHKLSALGYDWCNLNPNIYLSTRYILGIFNSSLLLCNKLDTTALLKCQSAVSMLDGAYACKLLKYQVAGYYLLSNQLVAESTSVMFSVDEWVIELHQLIINEVVKHWFHSMLYTSVDKNDGSNAICVVPLRKEEVWWVADLLHNTNEFSAWP